MLSQRPKLFFYALLTLSLSACVRGIVNAVQKSSKETAPLDTTHSSQRPSLDFSLMPNYLPREVVSKNKLDKLPDVCFKNTECGASIIAVNVTFADCGTPWTICRCEQKEKDQPYGPISMDDAIDHLARIPVGLRRYITTVLIVGWKQPDAYTLKNGEIHVFGNIPMERWFKEAMHAFDFFYPKRLSSSERWVDSIYKDTCTPDDQSLKNPVEDFAQMGVMKLFKMAHNDKMPEGWVSDCMEHQLEIMDSLPVFNETSLFGTCDMNSEGAPHEKAPDHDKSDDLKTVLVVNDEGTGDGAMGQSRWSMAGWLLLLVPFLL